jgi:hypothetical protein
MVRAVDVPVHDMDQRIETLVSSHLSLCQLPETLIRCGLLFRESRDSIIDPCHSFVHPGKSSSRPSFSLETRAKPKIKSKNKKARDFTRAFVDFVFDL